MDTVMTVLVLGFGLVFFVAVSVRLVLALRRRRPGSSLRDSVLRPVLGASAISALPSLDTRTTEYLNHHGPAHHPAEISLEEPRVEQPRAEEPRGQEGPDQSRE